MRYSACPEDEGYFNYKAFGEKCLDMRVFVDSVQQDFVVTFDDAEGWADVYVFPFPKENSISIKRLHGSITFDFGNDGFRNKYPE